jgi:hypothetical protein
LKSTGMQPGGPGLGLGDRQPEPRCLAVSEVPGASGRSKRPWRCEAAPLALSGLRAVDYPGCSGQRA